MKRGLLCSVLAVAVSLLSCKGDGSVPSVKEQLPNEASLLGHEGPEGSVPIRLEEPEDSLSYAVGVLFSSEMRSMMKTRGIAAEQAPDFAKGLKAAFPVDASAKSSAYANGVRLAAKVAETLEYEKSYAGVKTVDINRVSLRAALLDVAGGESGADKVVAAKQQLEKGGDAKQLSYAIGVLLYKDYSGFSYGISTEDMGSFAKGIGDAFPLAYSKQASAFVSGVGASIEADVLLEENRSLFRTANCTRVNRRAYIEAVAASALGKNGKDEQAAARELFHHYVYKAPARKFLEDNRVRRGVQELPSGLQYKVTELGNGGVANEEDVVSCIYKCTLTDGYILATTQGKAADVKVNEQLQGFKEALMTLPAGTKCMLYLPWDLAFGADGQGLVPPYTVIVYDLEIKGVK